MANTSLNVVDLDRDGQVADLQSFMRSQAYFKDYDFNGPTGILLRLLAYNTAKSGFLVNMLFGESFLDSAQMRSSIFSHAKDLNYLPRSIRSSQARVRVTFSATGENQPYVVPKGSTFSSLVKNTSYVFSTSEAITVSSADTNFTFEADLYEGSYLKDVYSYQTTEDEPIPRFPITNASADLTSLTVVVRASGGQIGETYTYASSLLDVTDQSKVFFVQASATGGYEVLFGDGIVGSRPAEGSVVVVDYRVTLGDVSNGASNFVSNFDPTGGFGELTSAVKVTTLSNSIGGAPEESLDSIRYYSTRWYQARERAVVDEDYVVLLRRQFPEITAVNVYGGEEADPSQYGKVLISIAIAGFDQLPESRVSAYTDFIRRRNSMGIKPAFISPEYTYVLVKTAVKYNVAVTTESPSRIQSLVSSAVGDYNSRELNDFKSTLRYSRLLEAIDAADQSIVSNETDLLCYKKYAPTLLDPNTFDLQFNLKLQSGIPPVSYPHALGLTTVVSSSSFTFEGLQARIEDDGQGGLCVVQDSGGRTNFVQTVGSVDYSSGLIQVKNLVVSAYEGLNLLFYVRPDDLDVSTIQNTILTIEPSGIDVQVEQVTE